MINAMLIKMIEFYNGNTHDIEHSLKVHAYARAIGLAEHLDPEMQTTLEMAAIVHDIACPLCREKYGAAYGNRQEEESPALLEVFLKDFDLSPSRRDRIIYLVSHHHTTTEVDGSDYRILLEADFLVNASEARMDRSAIQTFYDQVAKTDTARRLFRSIYLS